METDAEKVMRHLSRPSHDEIRKLYDQAFHDLFDDIWHKMLHIPNSEEKSAEMDAMLTKAANELTVIEDNGWTQEEFYDHTIEMYRDANT